MFGGVTVQELGQEAGDIIALLYALQDAHNTPEHTQAAYMLHQSRQHLRRLHAALQSYQLTCENPCQDKVLVQKEMGHAQITPSHSLGSASVRTDNEDPRGGNRKQCG